MRHIAVRDALYTEAVDAALRALRLEASHQLHRHAWRSRCVAMMGPEAGVEKVAEHVIRTLQLRASAAPRRRERKREAGGVRQRELSVLVPVSVSLPVLASAAQLAH